eukprot:scaffold20238_cov65-Phaeocystis_antarctica.AAC.4
MQMHCTSLRGGATTRDGATTTPQGGANARRLHHSWWRSVGRRLPLPPHALRRAGELRRAAASCGELWLAAASCGELGWAGRTLTSLHLSRPAFLQRALPRSTWYWLRVTPMTLEPVNLPMLRLRRRFASGWSGAGGRSGTRRKARGVRRGGFERALARGGFERALAHSGPPMPQPQSSTRSDSCRVEVVPGGACMLSVSARVERRSGANLEAKLERQVVLVPRDRGLERLRRELVRKVERLRTEAARGPAGVAGVAGVAVVAWCVVCVWTGCCGRS